MSLPKLPDTIQVNVKKGESGALLARLPEYDVFTEADNLNDLVFQVNDLIYTYFDVPKKYQDSIFFRPLRATQEALMKIADRPALTSYRHVELRSLYSSEVHELMYRTHAA